MSTAKLSPETQKTVELLLRCGVPQTQIAKETGVTVRVVSDIAQFNSSSTFTTRLNAKDSELADGMRALAWKAWEVANETLMFGSPSDQNILARSIISRSMALIGAEKTSKIDELRDEFNALIGSTQSPDDFDYTLPEDRDDAIELGTLTEYTDDPR